VTINNNLNVTGAATVSSLNVSGVSTLVGAVTINNNLNVTGAATVSSLNVSGTSTFAGAVKINNSLNVTSTTTIYGTTTVANSLYAQTIYQNNVPLDSLYGSAIIGSMIMYAGTTAPSGYLNCDGSAVSRNTYSSLFAVISTLYGSGDGSTTFNVPNLQGKFPIGASTTYTIATSGGNSTKTLSTSEMPAHNHSYTYYSPTGYDQATVISDRGTFYYWYTENNAGPNTITSNTGNAGSGTAFSLLNPYLAINYYIKY
jgi:microcystin-dependent protein